MSSSLIEFLAGRLLVKRKKAYRWTCNNTIIFEKVHICVLVDPTNRISFDNLFAGIYFLSSFFFGEVLNEVLNQSLRSILLTNEKSCSTIVDR